MGAEQRTQVTIRVQDKVGPGTSTPIAGATVTVSARGQQAKPAQKSPILKSPILSSEQTDEDGNAVFHLDSGTYDFAVHAFGHEGHADNITVPNHTSATIDIPVGFQLNIVGPCGEEDWCPTDAQPLHVQATYESMAKDVKLRVDVPGRNMSFKSKPTSIGTHGKKQEDFFFDTRGRPGGFAIVGTLRQAAGGPRIVQRKDVIVEPAEVTKVTGNVHVKGDTKVSGDVAVTMRRAAAERTEDIPLWVVIRKSTDALSFNNYYRFMNYLLCGERLPEEPDFESDKFPHKAEEFTHLRTRRHLPFTDADAYRVLKVATEAFVVVNCGVALDAFPFDDDDEDYVARRVGIAGDKLDRFFSKYLVRVNGSNHPTLPYLAQVRAKLADSPLKKRLFEDLDRLSLHELERRTPEECNGILESKLTSPCLLELIWSYWHEEGMLVQTINAITRRFQNVRSPGAGLDPLGNLEIDPLRPLNNLLWGYLQDEQHRLSVVRRNYEYNHHYGLRLQGKAVRALRAADTRSKFLEALHHLLHLCTVFYKQDDNTTIVADGFPVLNGLKEVHLILSEGAHNQFGDLPSTARIEMLMQQWLLARPEFREFLPTRIMVAYPEPWMDRVDAMKKLQGWSDTNVLHFRNLGMFGEQLLLTIRYGAWSNVYDAAQAANWARFWRPEIQGYVHAYRSATGVDLTATPVGAQVNARLPSTLLEERLAAQQRTS